MWSPSALSIFLAVSELTSGEAEHCEPLATEIDVVSRVEKRAAEIPVEWYARAGETLRQAAFIRPFAQHHVEDLAIDHLTVGTAPDARQFMS